ncbi:MAG: phosphotransferase, partial [Chloroflexota bacterium]|nr:phosphotransferase [Chloroflexota bacterium]
RFRRPVSAPQLLGEGLLNQSWRIDAPDGPYVLRVSRPERSSGEVAYEHTLIRALHETVAAVVPPLPGHNGETVQRWRRRILSLFPYIEGTPGTAVEPDVRSQQAATTLAQVHRVSVNLGFGQRPGWRSVDEHPRFIWPTVRPVLEHDLRDTAGLADLYAVFDREVSSLDAWLDDLHRSGRPLLRAPVHGDMNPRNLIFQRNNLVAVIDWDDCRLDPIAWEVAQVGFGASDTDPSAFFRSYLDAGGPLAPDDFELLGGFARMGALSDVQWTTQGDRAEHAGPQAVATLREVAASLAWLREREGDLKKP